MDDAGGCFEIVVLPPDRGGGPSEAGLAGQVGTFLFVVVFGLLFDCFCTAFRLLFDCFSIGFRLLFDCCEYRSRQNHFGRCTHTCFFFIIISVFL
jgi:hypothetical protein